MVVHQVGRNYGDFARDVIDSSIAGVMVFVVVVVVVGVDNISLFFIRVPDVYSRRDGIRSSKFHHVVERSRDPLRSFGCVTNKRPIGSIPIVALAMEPRVSVPETETLI